MHNVLSIIKNPVGNLVRSVGIRLASIALLFMTAGTGQIKAQMQFNDNLKVDADTKPYFHARPLAYDGDCGCESCWVDADGKPVGRRILVKTNVPAWACLWQNVAAEIDIIPHFSFELPIYWSPYNYGKRTLKFRTFSIIPKFRYYPSPDNDGLFFDVHAGFAYYNVALDGNHRYQDHNGKTPALGGGIGVGYRFRLPQSPRWKIEVALGAGFYGLDYDVFKNGRNGLIVDRVQRTFFGIDNFAVSLSYEFYVRPRNKQKKGVAL